MHQPTAPEKAAMSDRTKAPPPVLPRRPASPGAEATATPLDNLSLFRPLTAQVRADLAAGMKKRVCAPGEVIFVEGDPGDAMYLIEEGYVSIYVTHHAMGVDVDVSSLGKGEAFGEMALVTGEGRKASARALEQTTLWVLHRELFFRIAHAGPQAGNNVAATLARRLDQVNRTQKVVFGTLQGASMTPELVDAVPLVLCLRHKMVPVQTAAGVLTVACVDPQNRVGLDEILGLLRGMDLKVMAVAEEDFTRFMSAQDLAARVRQMESETVNYAALARGSISYLETDDDKIKQIEQAADVGELLDQVLFEGIDRGASDIHLEPERSTLAVRYRVDGRLMVRAGHIPINAHPAFVSRLKVLAGIDIGERRLPQDGRISLKIHDKSYDLRVATVNTKYGEKLVMRILDPSSLQADLASLILADKVFVAVRDLFYHPNGLVLVTGPTGSGKSTTLYASLVERRSPEVSIVTIEDPIEYTMEGITQVQVNEAIGLGFPDVMRTFMRQDPNVILVGETRDAATAKLACSAALTGHLVISSFHTNDAISAIERMRAMGLDNYLIADSLRGVINQRLVRRNCIACRVETDFGEVVGQNLMRAGISATAHTKYFKGTGCGVCRGEGFKGRAGIYELLVVTPGVKDAIARGAAAHDIRAMATKEGSYVNLARYAGFVLGEGLTIPSEVMRILPKVDG